ncbi:MAG: DMT family transporter [Firmicutes bacterium]|nr:DMT family transporter [Bacillota bacterium]
MLGFLVPLLVAAASGMAMTFQGTINSALSKRIGVGPMSLIVHVVGTILSLFVVIAVTGFPRLEEFKNVPLWAYAGGILNVAIIGGVAYAIARTGATLGISAILIGQLTTAVVLDHLGIFTLERIPISWVRLVGVALMLIGARLTINK